MANFECYEELDPFEVIQLGENKDVDGLIDVLRRGKNKNRIKQAIFALGEIGDDKGVEPLIDKALKGDFGIAVRKAAIRALGDIGSDRAVEPLIFLMLKSEYVRVEAVKALGKIRDARAVKPLNFVLEDENEDQNVREEIVEALGEIAAEEAIMSLIAVLNTDLDEKASRVLKEVGKPAVMPLITALNSDNETIMWKAATTLEEIGDKRAVEPLIALLLDESKDEYDRGYYVATALGRIGDPRAVKPLITLASKHDEDMLTCMSVRALGQIGDHEAVEPLISILEDRETRECSHLRLETCWALCKLKDPRAIESLIKILENHRKTTYGLEDAAALALVELDDDRIELPLLKFFKVALEARAELNVPEHQQDEVLEAVVKLIGRLIKKFEAGASGNRRPAAEADCRGAKHKSHLRRDTTGADSNTRCAHR